MDFAMTCPCGGHSSDPGPVAFAAGISREALHNPNFRTALWTGNHLQLTLMSIPPCGEIGLELHPDTDQFIRVEEGQALALMGSAKDALTFQRRMGAGDAVFVPCGTWHNVRNVGSRPLKLSTIYGPPQHPRGTVHPTKADEE